MPEVVLMDAELPERPPLGVMPFRLWHEINPDPSPMETRKRVNEVMDAVVRYLVADREPKSEWIIELSASSEHYWHDPLKAAQGRADYERRNNQHGQLVVGPDDEIGRGPTLQLLGPSPLAAALPLLEDFRRFTEATLAAAQLAAPMPDHEESNDAN